MIQANNILDGPDHFFCSKTGCRLITAACLKRQKANRNRARMQPVPFPECVECLQGKKNKALKGGLPGTAKPCRGNGNRKMDCELYEICLDTAAKRDWKSFKCDECDHQKKSQQKKIGESRKMDIKRLCRICGKKPPLHKNNEMCPSCMSKKSWETRKNKKKSPDVPKKKATTQGKTHSGEVPKKSVKEQNRAVTIDFKEHSSILREIEKLADEEIRPLGLQVIYMLRSQLKACQQDS